MTTSIYNISNTDSKEFQEYIQIINIAKSGTRSKTLNKSTYENHHILPKSLGGNNDNKNLVLLTYKEHFKCHQLLPEFLYGKNKHKMIHALWNMCVVKGNKNQRDYEVSENIYIKAREQHSKLISIQQKERIAIYGNSGKNNPMYGKSHSEETKIILSNVKSTGLFITPWGEFTSSNNAAKRIDINISPTTIRKWCRNNLLVISSSGATQSSYLTKEHIGKTFNEIGFDFVTTKTVK